MPKKLDPHIAMFVANINAALAKSSTRCLDDAADVRAVKRALLHALSDTTRAMWDFRAWREEFDEEHLLDGFDMCIAFLGARGVKSDDLFECAEKIRDEDAKGARASDAPQRPPLG